MSENDSGWTKVNSRKSKPKSKVPNSSVLSGNDSSKSSEDTGYVNPWDKVTVIHGRGGRPTAPPPTKQRYGRPNTTSSNFNATKLDKADTPDALPTVGLSMGQLIQQYRNQQNLSQGDLLKKIGGRGGVTLSDIQNIEKGVAISNNNKIMAIENALNVHVRGKLIGKPKRRVVKSKVPQEK